MNVNCYFLHLIFNNTWQTWDHQSRRFYSSLSVVRPLPSPPPPAGACPLMETTMPENNYQTLLLLGSERFPLRHKSQALYEPNIREMWSRMVKHLLLSVGYDYMSLSNHIWPREKEDSTCNWIVFWWLQDRSDSINGIHLAILLVEYQNFNSMSTLGRPKYSKEIRLQFKPLLRLCTRLFICKWCLEITLSFSTGRGCWRLTLD